MSFEELSEEYKKLQQKYEMQQQKFLKQQKDFLEQQVKYAEQQAKYESAQLELNMLRRMVFGTKRETLPKNDVLENGNQCSLFSNGKDVPDDFDKQLEEKTKEITVHKKKDTKKKKAGLKRSALKDVITEIQEFTLGEEGTCPTCDAHLIEIGKEIVRQEIKFTPAKFNIVNFVQYTYKCEKCGTEKSDNENVTFVKTQIPRPLLNHSFVSPSLAAEVMYQKYCIGVPLYRQEKMWDDKGLVLPRNMMANWNIKLTEYYFEELYNVMKAELKSSNSVMHCDETSIQCNREAGRKASSESYMWVLRSGELENKKGVIFRYAPTRSAALAKDLLKDYKGILVTDGYAAYNDIENVTHAGCWSHCRRKFYDSIPLDEKKQMDTACDGYKGVTYCDKLFEIERQIADFELPEKLKARKEKSKPVLEEFFAWVETTKNEKIVLNKKLKDALVYASNQKEKLSRYLEDGRIPMTNNIVERSIRPFAVHRKNWLFADSAEGAKTNGIIYSIIESAKINKINVRKYLEYLLEKIPQLDNAHDKEELKNYLPWSDTLPEEIMQVEENIENEEMQEA